MRYVFSGKRGSLIDPILSGAYILKISITIFIAIFVWLAFQTVMQNVVTGTSSETIIDSVLSNLTASYYSIDYVFPLLVGGLLIVSTIFAFKTGSNIVWGILSVILWGLALLFAAVFQNVYLSVSDEFVSIYQQFVIMDALMTHLTWLVLGWVAIISAVMFRKTNAEDDSMSGRFYG